MILIYQQLTYMNTDLDPKYQNLPAQYDCESCGTTTNVSRHCGHPMHLEDLSSGREWVCWMGASCGHQEYNTCCDEPSIPVYETVNP